MTTKQSLAAMRAEWECVRSALQAAGVPTRERTDILEHVNTLVTLSERIPYHRTRLDPLWDWIDGVGAGLWRLLGR